MPTDTVLASAVDVARAAAQKAAPNATLVGEHLGVVAEGDRVLSHRFVCLDPGYVGWEWSVTLARVPRARKATVSEVGLVAGSDALRAPQWVPWSQRLEPGDIGATDVLPFVDEDERLEEGYASSYDDAHLEIFEIGLGRERVLSKQGRNAAALRWYRGSQGPTSTGAIASAQPCSTCGFLVFLAGALRAEFGVCANEWSADDGKVVSMDHGCGAHSQTDVDRRRWQRASTNIHTNMDIEVIMAATQEEADGGTEPEAVKLPGKEIIQVAQVSDSDEATASPEAVTSADTR